MLARRRIMAGLLLLLGGLGLFVHSFRPHVDPRYAGDWCVSAQLGDESEHDIVLHEDGTWTPSPWHTARFQVALSSYVGSPPSQRTWFVQHGTLTLIEIYPDRISRSFISSVWNSLQQGEFNWSRIRSTALSESKGQSERARYDIIPVSGDVMLRIIGPDGHSGWGRKLTRIQKEPFKDARTSDSELPRDSTE